MDGLPGDDATLGYPRNWPAIPNHAHHQFETA
jgi:hypothetical protein